MTPKNLMDDKQLNFNQPLLSVRRGSSTAHPEVETKKTAKPSPTIPPLPFYRSELKSGPVRNPGVVPFKWEQIPGKPKNERKVQNKAHEQMAIINDEKFSDKPSQESVGPKSRLDNDGSTVSGSSSMCKNGREENGSSVSEGENSNYVDAVDSLSRSDSSFLNCSVSGLDDSNTKLTETSSDPLSRDLMMGRFLPAAKAVASETPHFGIKKQQPVLKEQQSAVKKDMTSEKQKIYYYAPISFPQRPQVKEEEEDSEDEDEEEEDYDIDFGENENVSLKLCGLLPRFCLLNPLPGVRDQLPRPVSSARNIHKKPANAGAFSKTDKAIRDAVYERRRLAVYKKSDMRVDANRLKHELNELYPQIDAMRLKDALKCSSSEISDRTAKDSDAAKLTTRRKAQTKSPESLKDVIAQQEPALAKATMEKTLYIDSAQMTEYRDSSSSESRSLAESRGRNPSIDYSFHDFKDMILSQEHQVKDSDVQQLPNKDDTEITMDKNPVLPLPLPKSPSESWLSRALPSVSSRNPRSYISTGNLGFRSSPVDPKWEAIANSSKLHSKHFGLPPMKLKV
ncbi:hypothetical protein V2J09_002738 [Rumex salicifolius]